MRPVDLKSPTIAILTLVLVSCSGSQGRRQDVCTDTSAHRSEYVTVNGVRLNYLDWGGSGPTLVLIHGLADSPHIFDDLAQSLRDRFHVIAYARRGHGHSDAPAGPYDQDTLVEDLRQLLDQLRVARTSLLGFSMGGNEITEFAGRYPDRVEELIYLEAGYDWSDFKFQSEFAKLHSEFPPLNPSGSALGSLDAYRTWFRKTWFGETSWTPGLESYLCDIVRLEPDDKVHPVPFGSVLDALSASNAKSSRNYRQVRAPALALYAASFLPMDAAAPDVMRVSQAWEEKVMTEFRRASIERLRHELPQVVVQEFPKTSHLSIFIRAQDAVTAAIREFLGHAGPQ